MRYAVVFLVAFALSGCLATMSQNYEACLSDAECTAKVLAMERTIHEGVESNPAAVLFGTVAGFLTGGFLGWKVRIKKVPNG